MMDKAEIAFSAGLFHYWDTVQIPSFDWRVTSHPSFIVNYVKDGVLSSKPMVAKTRKLAFYQTETEVEQKIFQVATTQNLDAFEAIDYHPLQKMIYEKTTLEMERFVRQDLTIMTGGSRHYSARIYVYAMFPTPTIYDATLALRQGYMIRYTSLYLEDSEIQEISLDYDGHNYTNKFYQEHEMVPIEWVRKNGEPTMARTEEEMRKQEEYETMILVRKIKRQLGYKIDEETPVF